MTFLKHCESAFTPRMNPKTADFGDFEFQKNREIRDLRLAKSFEDFSFSFVFDVSHKHQQK